MHSLIACVPFPTKTWVRFLPVTYCDVVRCWQKANEYDFAKMDETRRAMVALNHLCDMNPRQAPGVTMDGPGAGMFGVCVRKAQTSCDGLQTHR